MNWVETLAEYYRLSRTGETQHWLCRRWLPQGEARLAYLRELLEPTAAVSRAPAVGRRRFMGLTERYRRPTQRNSNNARQISSSTTTILLSLLPMRFVATSPSLN